MEQKNEKVAAVPMRGMRDLLPREVERRQSVAASITQVYAKYGFTEIETPVVERSELLNTGEGGDNEKQTFGILKRGLSMTDIQQADTTQDIIDSGLRFDLTVPLARYYAHNHAKLLSPFKALQIGSVFRAERPQKGRYRQFTQCDIDIIGEDSILAEKELLLATTEALLTVGFTGFTVRINDRRILKGIAYSCGYTENELDLVFIIIDKLDKIGLEGVAEELQTKVPQPGAAEKMMEFLRNSGTQTDNDAKINLLPPEIAVEVVRELRDIIETVETLTNQEFTIVFDPTLVRGMGYYTGPIFEIEDKDFPSSIAGGGRYDNMIGKYTDSPIPACGFSIGFERIMTLLEERDNTDSHPLQKQAVIYDPTTVSDTFALTYIQRIRAENNGTVSLHKRRKNTKNQLSELAEQGYSTYCLLINEQQDPAFKQID
jgi:histidyl-tRNA synthetase